MHICFITHEYPKAGFPNGGIGSFVKTIATALCQKNIRISVVGINYTGIDDNEIADGVTIYRLGKSNVKGLAWYFNSKAITQKIEKIHSFDPISIIEAPELGFAFIKKIKGVKYIIRLHGGHHFFAEAENRNVNTWKGFQEKRSFKKADAFIAVSQYVKTHTEKYLNYNNKPLASINSPINAELFKPLTGFEVSKKIIFAGTVCEKKGVRQLIQAFSLLKKQFPEAVLDIYGRDWLYPDRSSYIKMLQDKVLPRLGELAHDIHFHGPVDYEKIPFIFSQAEVCVFPSHIETQGLVAPEAMAMGKAVVFSMLGPGPETIVNYETGLLCDPHNPADIADKITWFFVNQEKKEIIEKKARAFVLKKYGLDTIVKQNKTFYESLLVE